MGSLKSNFGDCEALSCSEEEVKFEIRIPAFAEQQNPGLKHSTANFKDYKFPICLLSVSLSITAFPLLMPVPLPHQS